MQTYYLNIGNIILKLLLSQNSLFFEYWNRYLTQELIKFHSKPSKEDIVIKFVGPKQINFKIHPNLDRHQILTPFKITKKTIRFDSSLNTRYFQIILEQILVAKTQKQNKILLHASAIAIDNKAIIITGPSGAGKSTTLNKLLNFGSVLADDILILEKNKSGVSAYPSPFNSKVDHTQTQNKAYPVRLVIFPKKGDRLKISPRETKVVNLAICDQILSMLNSSHRAKLGLSISSDLSPVSYTLEHTLNQSIIKEIRKKLP